ncbi:Protein translocase subunit SecY [Polystyrenella longa]|uniref:Protein translocase subunit SecY n=2 Tax=Polystyrenella longa TaxID=2528007 RepID=A0A518CR78_9PLAN|nr:Protein translocase subunit SecY [Polystyrenella longa]
MLTLGLLLVYRLGSWIPLPIVSQELLRQNIENMAGDTGGLGQMMQIVSMFSGSNLEQATIFGLGIMPYISASIIFQLLTSVYPPLEQLKKEGESGQRKINEYTRYATIPICLVQSYMWINWLRSGMGSGMSLIQTGYDEPFFIFACVLTMTVGTLFLMWVGEQIDAYGIGNGISLLIMAGILARMPIEAWGLISKGVNEGVQLGAGKGLDVGELLILAVIFVTVVVGVIAITQGQRRIPIQSAKHVRGNRVMGGQRQSLPLRVNQAGVMPIIFASSMLLFPTMMFSWLGSIWPESSMVAMLTNVFSNSRSGYIYNVLYIFLVYFFCYFWTAIMFNPKEISENLQNYGSFIPGYRPGNRTAAYLEQVMIRITYVGAAFLSVIAIFPTLIMNLFADLPVGIAMFYGGTGLLIVVSVALDLVQKIDSHLVMHNYSGLLEADDR